jgi:hypothetical protein
VRSLLAVRFRRAQRQAFHVKVEELPARAVVHDFKHEPCYRLVRIPEGADTYGQLVTVPADN